MSPSAPHADRAHLRVAGLCFLVLFLEGYDVTSMSYATPSLIDAWHVRAPQFTTAVTMGGFGMLFGSLCAGLLGDRLGRKPVLVGCVATFGVFSLLTTISTDLATLATLRFLTCLGLGGGVPLSIALATDYAPQESPRRLVILMSAGLSIGSTAGGLLARQFVSSLGWKAIFIAGGLPPLLLIPLLILFLPECFAFRGVMAPARQVGPLVLFRHGLALQTIVLWIVNLGSMLGLFFILSWLPAILHAQGFSPTDSIFVATIYALGSVLGIAITAPIVDRFGAERVIACVLGLGACCVLFFGMLALPYAALCLVIGGVGIGIGGGQHGINAISGAVYPAAIRSTGAGWALGVGRIGQIAGPLAGGLLLGFGWRPGDIFLAASGPAFCVALGMAALSYLRIGANRPAAAMPSLGVPPT